MVPRVRGKPAVLGRYRLRRVDGDSEEDGLDATTGTQVTLKRVSGGTQRSLGVFVQDVISPVSSLTMTLSALLDQWRNYDGHNSRPPIRAACRPPTTTRICRTGMTPSSARASPRVITSIPGSAWGDIGAGFRAPTLNELYRQFRVGTVLTLANNQLGRNAWSAANSASRSFRRQTFSCARPISTTGSRTRSRT